jgi:hypothetical protein
LAKSIFNPATGVGTRLSRLFLFGANSLTQVGSGTVGAF